jgi:hypothetical protein
MTSIPLTREVMNRVLRADFGVFLERVFQELNGGETFKTNWHIDAMCHVLDEVRQGRNRRLVITVPPRHLKSITVSVAFVAWAMGHDPMLKFLVASYGGDLAVQLARDFRRVVEASWYQAAFPEFGKPRRSAEGELVTKSGGFRKAISVGGATTGFGADYIIVDDLMKATDGASPAAREAAWDYYRGSLISRLNDQANGRIVVIAQRLHEEAVVNVMAVSLTSLIHHFGSQMAARGRGGIIMVGSLSGAAGVPNMAPYCGAKAYVQIFGEALWSELKPSGIDVLTLVLGVTDTPAKARNGVADVPGMPIDAPDDVAQLALDNLADGGPVLAPPTVAKIFDYLNRTPRRQLAEQFAHRSP